MIRVCYKSLQNKKVFISLIDLVKLEGGWRLLSSTVSIGNVSVRTLNALILY